MALRQNQAPASATATVDTGATAETATAAASGMFEEDNDTVVAERPTSATSEAKEAQTAEPKPIPGTAVAVANQSAMALALRKSTGLDDAQFVIDAKQLEQMGVGTFPRVTVDQGGFSRDKTDFLGSWIKIRLLSWNPVTLVTAGEKDDKDADKLIRSSYDGVNIAAEGCTVNEYLAKLRENYENASIKGYVEIYAELLTFDKDKAPTDEPPMVQISVSPQSVKQWQRFLLESRMRAARGVPPQMEFCIGSKRVTQGSNTYGVMEFGFKP